MITYLNPVSSPKGQVTCLRMYVSEGQRSRPPEVTWAIGNHF